MILQFVSQYSAQIDLHQKEVGSEADKQQYQTGEQHIAGHFQFGIGQVQSQFQTFALHLGNKLYDGHQHSGN